MIRTNDLSKLLGLILLPLSAAAGTQYSFSCLGPQGRFEGEVSLGGGRAFEQITGFCLSKNQFVYITWKRTDPAPTPIQVWNPNGGPLLMLYQSKDCPEPILPIRSIEQLDALPVCREGSLRFKSGILFD